MVSKCRVQYERKVDQAYIDLGGGPKRMIDETIEISEGPAAGAMWLDLDEAGRLLGIEVLRASHYLTPELLDSAEAL